MFQGLRSYWLPSAAIVYVCFASLQAAPSGAILPWAAMLGLPLSLAVVWRSTSIVRRGEDRVEPAARSALRACFWGVAFWAAARSGPAGRPAFDAAANLGVGVAAVASLVALARVSSLGGLLTAPKATRSLDAAAMTGLLWGIAVALPATRSLLPATTVRLDPLAIDYATTTAGLGSLLVLVAATWRLRVLRRLEIGVGDRAAGALALAITAFLVAVPSAAFDVAPPDRILPTAVIAAAVACTWTATTPEPTTVSSALRGILAVMMLGAPTVLVAGLFARQMPQHAGAIVLFACSGAIVVGLIARAVAKPLGPEQSRWLDAIEAASRGALQPEPNAAIRAALAALGGTTSTPGARPELWRNDPEEVLSVDIAGYLHVDQGQAPERLYELCMDEPERTLRAEALRALEVRRPEIRPLLSWFDARRAFSATVVLDEDGPLGFLLLPRGNRTTPMTLEEARAVRVLADRISALLAVSSALARSRERELLAIRRADAIDDERQRLEHIILSESERNERVASRLARSIRSSAYSPQARMTVERLEKLGRMNASATLLVPPGVDAVGWAALVHLESARKNGPFVVVDATGGAEHDLERWTDPKHSPLALADGGTLAILDLPALPVDIQSHIARTLTRQTTTPARSSVLPAALVASLHQPLAELTSSGRIDKKLGRLLGDAEVRIPSLAERSEDLRALVLGVLARVGLRTHGEPLGIDPAALRLLMEHTWPGNEVELSNVLLHAAGNANGRVVTAADLAAADFRPVLADSAVTATPLPSATRRRGRGGRRSPRRRG